MSILIKGIDLPKEGEDITLEINHEGEVRAYSTELKETDTEAQAIQIPTPHGRLIDTDKLCESILKTMDKNISDGKVLDNYGLSLAQGFILGSPTIIEAEE